MIRAAIIVAPGFQDEEFVYPYYRMLEEGYDISVFSDYADCRGKFGVPAKRTHALPDLQPQAWDIPFDLVFIPGGFESPDRIRENENVKSFIRGMNTLNRCIAAICHGPWVLASAGILKGRRATAYKSISADIINAGAQWVGGPVVIDQNIITADHYASNAPFMKALVTYMRETYQREGHVERALPF